MPAGGISPPFTHGGRKRPTGPTCIREVSPLHLLRQVSNWETPEIDELPSHSRGTPPSMEAR